jgi:2-C-methyl-D-erythritol 2,4-cyclodiphosphate synthase
MFRIGYGSDIHRLATGERMVLGGVEIESDLGTVGHSDADALTHAVTDAILGALALGDIGQHFSDGEERRKNAESFVFLRYAVGLVKERGYAVVNVDSTVVLELPKLRPHIDKMRENLAQALEVETNCISVKAKSGEGVDAVGERLAIRAEAVLLLRGSVDRP